MALVTPSGSSAIAVTRGHPDLGSLTTVTSVTRPSGGDRGDPGAALWMRISGVVVVALAAAVLSIVACFTAMAYVGATPAPVGTAVTVLVNCSLPWISARVAGVRAAAAVPAAVWVLVALVAAAPGPGGDIILPGTWQGFTFLLLGAVAALVGVIWLSGMPASAARRAPTSADRAAPGAAEFRSQRRS